MLRGPESRTRCNRSDALGDCPVSRIDRNAPANTLGRVIASAEKATTRTAQVFAAGAAIKSRSRLRQSVGFSSIGMERRQKDPVAEGDLGLCLIGAWLTLGISSQVLL